MSEIGEKIAQCVPLLKKKYRLLLVIGLGVWIILMEVISKSLGFTFYIIVVLLLLFLIGFSDVNKCATPKDVFYNILPSMVLIILFSVVAVITNSQGLQLLGIDESVSGQAVDEINDMFANVYTLALTSNTFAGGAGTWAAIYLPFYIGGAIVTIIGDAFDQKFAKASGIVLVFMPVIIQFLGAFTGGVPDGILGSLLPDLGFLNNAIIEQFMSLVGSALDWLIASILVGVVLKIPEEEEGGGEE